MSALSLNSLSDVSCTLTISHIPKNLTEADLLNEIKAVAGQSSFILYMPQEKAGRHSGRAFVCLNDAIDTMSCFKALNRKRLGGSKGKRCAVELGLVHRKQAPQGADIKKTRLSGTVRTLFSQTAKRSSPSPTCMDVVDINSDSRKGGEIRGRRHSDSLDVLAEVSDVDADVDDLEDVDPNILSRFESRFGHK
jgi:hypothetical protein